MGCSIVRKSWQGAGRHQSNVGKKGGAKAPIFSG